LLQLGNGARELLLSAGRRKILVSGDSLAFLDGNLDYFTGDIFKHLWRSSLEMQPSFVVTGHDPAASIAALTGCDVYGAPLLSIKANKCVVMVLADWEGTEAVVKYAACEEAIAELELQATGLTIAASDPQIRHLLPRLLAHTPVANGAVVLVQTRIPSDPYRFSWRLIDAAMELWLSRKPAFEQAGRAWLGQRLAQLCVFFSRFRDLLLPIMDALQEWNESHPTPGGVTHGDFCLWNVLFKGESLSGIVDWDMAQKDGFLQVDYLAMLLGTFAEANNQHVGYYLRQFWADEISDGALLDRIARLSTHCGMDKDNLKFIALLLWFNLLWQKVALGALPNSSWIEQMIPQTVPSIMNWLNGHAHRMSGSLRPASNCG
jgi:hypothetical protein